MSTKVLDPGTVIEIDEEIEETTDLEEGGIPPIFGRCPVCKKPLFPRDKITGEAKAPPPGKGYESRAKCSGCGTILYYKGDGKWGVLSDDDLSEDDRMADKLGL